MCSTYFRVRFHATEISVIGYYVHHHGRGHLMRAQSISAHLAEPVTFLSSLPRPAGLRADDAWVQLPSDVPAEACRAHDVTANGRLHWVPLHDEGLRRRSAMLLGVLAAARARHLVVDVSVEIAVLARLAGIPVTVIAMPGERSDPVHRLAFDVAENIVGCWPQEVYDPDWLTVHASRTHFVGAISRFDGRASIGDSPNRPATGLMLCGAGGSAFPADALEQLRRAVPQITWRAVGGAAAWVDDPWSLLASADIVVTHAGQNAIADVATAGVPAVVIAQPRPFGEQRAMCEALDWAGVAVTSAKWPAPECWPALLDKAIAHGGKQWRRMRTAGAAARAAAVIAQ